MYTWTVDSFSLCLFLRESEGNSCLLSVLCASTSLGGFSLYKYLYSARRDGKVNKAWSLPLRRSWSCGGDRWVNLQLVLSVRGARWRDIETRLENQGFYRGLSPWHWCWLEKSRREGRRGKAVNEGVRGFGPEELGMAPVCPVGIWGTKEVAQRSQVERCVLFVLDLP